MSKGRRYTQQFKKAEERRLSKKIGIIGDVHAEDTLLAMAIDWLEKKNVDVIICTGDIADGLGDINAACNILASNAVLTVAGNHDRWLLTGKARHVENAHYKSAVHDRNLQFLDELPKTLSLPIHCGDLLLCHGVLDDDLAKIWPGTTETEVKRSLSFDKLLSQSSNVPSFVVNGHMHFRTLIDFEACKLINAGTLKGLYSGLSILDLDAQTLNGFDFAPGGMILPSQNHLVSRSDGRRVWRDTQAFEGHWEPVVLHQSN